MCKLADSMNIQVMKKNAKMLMLVGVEFAIVMVSPLYLRPADTENLHQLLIFSCCL